MFDNINSDHLQLLEEQPRLQCLGVSLAAAQLRVGNAHAVLLRVLVRQQLQSKARNSAHDQNASW